MNAFCSPELLGAGARAAHTPQGLLHTLAGHAVDARTGLLIPIGHWPTQATPRGFAITPDGRFLLAAGQTSHQVGVHAIDSASGALTLVAEQPVGLNPNWVEVVG